MEIPDERVEYILEALLKFIQGDFEHTIAISDRSDAIDAIAIGLNAMAEELKSRESEVAEKRNQLENLNKELEAFSYSISHDLRAPLRAIVGYAKILEEDFFATLAPEAQKALSIIQRNALKMNHLIDDLLEFSKIGKQELVKGEIDTNQMVRDILYEINSSLHYQTKVVLNFLFPMHGDAAMLAQVWTNLISNALKYSAKKTSPEVEIGSAKENGEIVYYVKDNGAGFDMQYADRLFQIFQRLHNQQDYHGTGVGLSIVYRVIKKHNGRVWAEGKVDEGSTFYFSLPNLI